MEHSGGVVAESAHADQHAAELAREIAEQAIHLNALSPLERAFAAEALAASARAVIGSLATVRRNALIDARESGLTLTQIAVELGVSVQAVSQAIRKIREPDQPRSKEIAR